MEELGVEGLENPAGYLYTLGLNWGRKMAGRFDELAEPDYRNVRPEDLEYD